MEPNSHTAKEVEQAVHEVYTACQEWGFFQAIHHGIHEELIERVQVRGRQMFALPREDKLEIKRTATNARGWYDDELTKQTLDWKQGFDLGHVPHPSLPPDDPANVVAEGYNQWPKGIPGFKDTMDAFYSEAARVSSRLMWGISHSLGLHGGVVGAGAGMEMGGDILAEAFEGHTSYLRLNYYPPCPEPCDYLSVNRHTDAGALTVLLQEAGVTALQVNFNGTGQWVSIPPVEGAVTINVGDMLQVWTNDLFRAPEHRVRALTERDRFSAPFFYNPGYATDVAPLPQTLLAHTITTSSSSSSSPSCISTPADDGGGAGKVGDPNNSVGGGTIVRGEGSAGGGRNHCREDGNPGEERGKAAGFGATTGESSAGGGAPWQLGQLGPVTAH
ncbi:unnamed protein product [Discosporangium mesarthrocarpum]